MGYGHRMSMAHPSYGQQKSCDCCYWTTLVFAIIFGIAALVWGFLMIFGGIRISCAWKLKPGTYCMSESQHGPVKILSKVGSKCRVQTYKAQTKTLNSSDLEVTSDAAQKFQRLLRK